MTGQEYQFHPLANVFPMLLDSELSKLADDIKANGLNEPIVIYDDMILDGTLKDIEEGK